MYDNDLDSVDELFNNWNDENGTALIKGFTKLTCHDDLDQTEI